MSKNNPLVHLPGKYSESPCSDITLAPPRLTPIHCSQTVCEEASLRKDYNQLSPQSTRVLPRHWRKLLKQANIYELWIKTRLVWCQLYIYWIEYQGKKLCSVPLFYSVPLEQVEVEVPLTRISPPGWYVRKDLNILAIALGKKSIGKKKTFRIQVKGYFFFTFPLDIFLFSFCNG